MRRLFFLIFFCVVATSKPAKAGVIELSGSASYKKSSFDVDSFDESLALTGSVAYYFDESSALELSYTDAGSSRVVGNSSSSGYTTNLYYKMAGLDLVVTFGEREAAVRPYFKIGGAYIFDKRIVNQYWFPSANPPVSVSDSPGLVPSAGIGFKLRISQNWSFKLGAEAWSSRPMGQSPFTVDMAGRAGLSWMF